MRQAIDISPERIARVQSYGLTKYGPEQTDEIAQALADLNAAEAEYDAAIEAAWPIYTPAEDQRWIGWQCYLPESLANLYNISNDTDGVSFDRGGHGNESFPISLWKRNAAKFRRQARRIRQAIQEATAEAVA